MQNKNTREIGISLFEFADELKPPATFTNVRAHLNTSLPKIKSITLTIITNPVVSKAN